MHRLVPRFALVLTIGFLLSGCAGVADFIRNMEETDPPGVFSSTGEIVTYDYLYPDMAFQPWTGGCSIDPGVNLNANWGMPHQPTKHGKSAHDWQETAKASGFSANWITAGPELESPGEFGQSYSRFTSEMTGSGVYDLYVLVDDCAWIYLDGQHIASQGTQKTFSDAYPVDLDGTHTLDIIVYDGGGIGGLMFSLDTRDADAQAGRGPSARPQ